MVRGAHGNFWYRSHGLLNQGGNFITAGAGSKYEEFKYPPSVLHTCSVEETNVLNEWITKHGGDCSRVCVGTNKKGNRGLYLIKDVKEGETVIFVPEKCWITKKKFF